MSNVYVIVFTNETTGEIPCIMWLERDRFEHRDYEIIVSQLFMESAMFGVTGKLITANVYRGKMHGDKPVYNVHEPTFTMFAKSDSDGSTVWTDLYINGEMVRRMYIAD